MSGGAWEFDPAKTEDKTTEGTTGRDDTLGDTQLTPPRPPPPPPAPPEVDTTGKFEPGAASTPDKPPYGSWEWYEMQNFHPEQSGMGDTDPLLQPQKNQTRSFVKAVLLSRHTWVVYGRRS